MTTVNNERTPAEIESILSNYHGGEQTFQHPLGSLTYSEGVRAMAITCGAYWLIDVIASYQHRVTRDPMLSEFQLWTMDVITAKNGRTRAVVKCFRDSDGTPPVVVQRIPLTDFPLKEIKFYVENNLLCLPAER